MRGELHPMRDREQRDTTTGAPVDSGLLPGSDDEQVADTTALGPTGPVTRRNMVFAVLFILAAIVGLYFLVPKLAGLNQTWGRLERGNPLWLAVGAGLELLSVISYAVLFRTVFARGFPRLEVAGQHRDPAGRDRGDPAARRGGSGWHRGDRVGAQARRHGAEADRLPDGGQLLDPVLALPAGARRGRPGAVLRCFSGGGPDGADSDPRHLQRGRAGSRSGHGAGAGRFRAAPRASGAALGAIGRLATRFATLPATLGSGVRTALGLVRERRLGLLGAVGYWGFDIAVLGVSFKAFGASVWVAVLVMGYFLGTLGSLLPLPGGIGGVEGGMIGAFVAFGVPADRAVIAVLAYRAISFWLPTLPGIAGYVTLRSTVRGWRTADSEPVRED